MRRDHLDEAAIKDQLNQRGFLNRMLCRITKAVAKPWHMFPVGLLFGLGLTPSPTVALILAVVVDAATANLPS